MSNSNCESTIYDPALKVTVSAVDAREEFRILSEASPFGENDTQVFAAHKTVRHAKAALANGEQPTDAADDDGHSPAIGFWPIKGKLLFANFTAIRHVINFPNTVGGDFSSYLYLTSTNRSEKGTESHIAYVGQKPPEFWIFDWSLCNKRLARHVPISKMGKYIFPVVAQAFQGNGVLVMNQTRLVENTTWINCVHLGVFENGKLHHFDTVYSNRYELDSNVEQQPGCNGYWGPEVESFQNFARPINAMGFSGCWLIQDEMAITLDNSNTELHDEKNGLEIFFQTPLRDFLVH